MTTLRQAAQDLLDKIDERGASPLDWPEYSELQAVLAASEQEPAAWLVLDEDGVPIMCAPAKQMCNDHINDAINDFDITEAAKWVVREAFTHPSQPAQQVAVPDDAIIKEIERAIVDHCTGGDLWMSASLGKDRIKRLMEAQGVKV